MRKLCIHTVNYLRTGYLEGDITPEDYVSAILEYNDKGSVVSENNYNADATLQSATTTQYDEQDRPSVVSQYDGEGMLCERISNFYLADGKLSEQKVCYGEGLPEYATRYVYENGLLMRRDCYEEDEFLYSEKKFEYDAQGRLLKDEEFDEDGNKLYSVVNNYDENGKLSGYTRDEVQQHDRRTYVFEYDEKGNKVKELIYNYGESLIAKVYSTYNEQNLLLETEEEDLDHYRLTKYEYEDNNLTKVSVYGKEDQLLSYVIYAYDAERRLLTQDNYACDEVNPSLCRLMTHIDYRRE